MRNSATATITTNTMELNQVTLPACDLVVSVAFYRRMGFGLIADAHHYARFKSLEGDATFSLAVCDGPVAPSQTVLKFECADLEKQVQCCGPYEVDHSTSRQPCPPPSKDAVPKARLAPSNSRQRLGPESPSAHEELKSMARQQTRTSRRISHSGRRTSQGLHRDPPSCSDCGDGHP